MTKTASAAIPESNCDVAFMTISPMAAVLTPTGRTPETGALWFGDGSDRVVVTRRGWPVVPEASGETELGRWIYSSMKQDFDVYGTWFDQSGSLAQGVVANAPFAFILLTDEAVRIGLKREARGETRVRARDKMLSLDKGVYGAVFWLEDVEEIKAGRDFFSIRDSTCVLQFTRVNRILEDGSFGIQNDTSNFATAVMDEILARLAKHDDQKRREVAEELENESYDVDFQDKRPATFDLSSE